MTQEYQPSPLLAALLDQLPVAPLGPGEPAAAIRELLERADEEFCTPTKIKNISMAAACRAGLYLALGYLDESHAISQDLHTAEGSFWHAILHRREPDAWNSKYWFRQVGAHPVLKQLAEQAPALGHAYKTPFDFVDFCERVRGKGDAQEELARKVQALEWRLLFDWCYRLAVGEVQRPQ